MVDFVTQLYDSIPPKLRDPILFALGVFLLLLGGKLLVDGSILLARRLKLPTLLIGLTIVALGTSLPELAFNVSAAINHRTDLAFGNIIGSNIANVGLVLGATILLSPIVASGRIITRELPWLVICNLILVGLAWFPPHVPDALAPKRGFSNVDGVIMLGMLACFLFTWYRLAITNRNDPMVAEVESEAAATGERPLGVAIAFVLGGAVVLGLGARSTEVGAVGIARIFGVSEGLIGLTIVAVCTSLPELVTSVIAASRKQSDLILGNIVGSNIFNLLLILAVTSVITPIAVPQGIGWYDLAVSLALTIFLWPICTSRTRTIGRVEGAVLLGSYMAYMFWRAMSEL